MDLHRFSKKFHVRRLNQNDVELIVQLCSENHLFYEYHPPFVTKESILEDMSALPFEKTHSDKYYLGFFENETLAAVMDLIVNYPVDKTAFIGFFMLNKKFQNQGIGSCIINECADCLKEMNFEKIQLGVDKGNPQSYSFWLKNQFKTIDEDKYIRMERVF